MPGMNRSSRTIRLIESSLHRLETDASPTSLDALGVLDELCRLERKWREQVAELKGWYRRWLLASGRFNEAGLTSAKKDVERTLARA